jgi:hypothetical protein
MCTRKLIKGIPAKRVVLQRGRHYYYYYTTIFIYISPKAISHTSVAGMKNAKICARVQNR